jgi:feruloyl esterase
MVKRIVAVAILSAIGFAITGAGIAAAPKDPVTHANAPDMTARCAALIGKMDNIPDASTEVTEANLVESDGDLPAYCRVAGTVFPAVGIEMRLPTSGWNGKFFMFGRGGACRAITMVNCDDPVRRGYACIVTDQGHKSATESDDVWEYGNLQAKVDCGFRGTHVAAVAGKAITARYYRKPPVHSYFMGCSTGGRMAMLEATRFPYDFDGILAGAPPIPKFGDELALAWNALATMGKDGRQILTVAALKLVAKAVVAKCDMDDGVADGVVGDPWGCKFDPAELRCKPAQTDDCLTNGQIEALRKMYQGPVNSKGEKLFPGSVLPGSELNWVKDFVSEDGQPGVIYKAMTEAFRYAIEPERGPDWKLTQFDWDNDYKNNGLFDAYMGDNNPNLRPFKAAGGKLILYQGLADQLISPAGTLDYYKTVQRVMGGPASTEEFARLFLAPGLNHCGGGAGATIFDYVKYLDDWVANGNAPEVMIGAHVKNAAGGNYGILKQPLDPANVVFTRPVYKYPMMARYKGSGDPNDAANFEPALSSAP